MTSKLTSVAVLLALANVLLACTAPTNDSASEYAAALADPPIPAMRHLAATLMWATQAAEYQVTSPTARGPLLAALERTRGLWPTQRSALLAVPAAAVGSATAAELTAFVHTFLPVRTVAELTSLPQLINIHVQRYAERVTMASKRLQAVLATPTRRTGYAERLATTSDLTWADQGALARKLHRAPDLESALQIAVLNEWVERMRMVLQGIHEDLAHVPAHIQLDAQTIYNDLYTANTDPQRADEVLALIDRRPDWFFPKPARIELNDQPDVLVYLQLYFRELWPLRQR